MMINDPQQTTSPQKERGHVLMVRDRGQVTVSGVSQVVSFDEANVRLVTGCGILNLEGSGLRIHVLNTTDGTVAVTGRLTGVLYEDSDVSDERTSKPRTRRFFKL